MVPISWGLQTRSFPLARFAHECLLVSVGTLSFGASYTGPMCLLNRIMTACGHRGRRRRLALFRNYCSSASRWHVLFGFASHWQAQTYILGELQELRRSRLLPCISVL